MDPLRPFDIFSVATIGAPRVLIANYDDVDAPEGIHSVIDMVYPYAPVDSWENGGAAVSQRGYTRGLSSEGIDIQEQTGNLFEDITETTRTVSLPFAEINPFLESIIENSPAIDDIDAAPGVSEQSVVALQSISTLRRYRIAIIGVRRTESGVVVEPPDARQRGRFVGRLLNLCTLSADDTEQTMEKGSLAERVVAFTAFSDSEVDANDGDWGRVVMEKAGTVGSDPS
jgi:hypothetical protein